MPLKETLADEIEKADIPTLVVAAAAARFFTTDAAGRTFPQVALHFSSLAWNSVLNTLGQFEPFFHHFVLPPGAENHVFASGLLLATLVGISKKTLISLGPSLWQQALLQQC